MFERLVDYVMEAASSLRNRILRSLLAVVGIVIAVSSVISLYAVGEGSRAAIMDELSQKNAGVFHVHAGEIISSGLGRTVPLTDYELGVITRSLPSVTITPVQLLRLPFKYNRDSGIWNVTGISANGATTTGVQVVHGKFFSVQEEARSEPVLVLGFDLAAKLFGDPASAIGEILHLNGNPYRIVGTAKEQIDLFGAVSANTQVYIPLSLSRRLSNSNEFWKLTLTVPASMDIAEAEARVLSILKRLHPGAEYRISKLDGTIAELDFVFDLLTRVLMVITSLSLLVGGIGVTNVMLMSVTERTREIGVRRAIGARRMDVMFQFLIECCLLCVAGGLIGLLIASGLVRLIGQHLLRVELEMSIVAVALALSISFVMGLLCGCLPAYRATVVSPVESLRSE